jgi:hypothetical protein
MRFTDLGLSSSDKLPDDRNTSSLRVSPEPSEARFLSPANKEEQIREHALMEEALKLLADIAESHRPMNSGTGSPAASVIVISEGTNCDSSGTEIERISGTSRGHIVAKNNDGSEARFDEKLSECYLVSPKPCSCDCRVWCRTTVCDRGRR